MPSPTLGLGGNARPRLAGKRGLPIKCFVFYASHTFSLGDYIPTHRFGLDMPSKITVALSLDEVSSAIWDELPRGERSRYVREAMNKIDLIKVQEDLIMKLRNRLTSAEREISYLKVVK